LALADVVIREEGWHSMAVEAEALGREHFKETDEGVEPRRPWKLNMKMMGQIYDAGVLSIMSARDGEKLVGYHFWTITPDVESDGLIIAQHGPWFVLPGYPGIGGKLLKESLPVLKARGVHVCYPHHRLQGRGARLGDFYRRLGAVEIQHTYSLWIGD
jgi:hypothetical protein